MLYRAIRVLPSGRRRRRGGGWIKGTSGNHDIAADPVQKTARVAFQDDTLQSLTWAIPAAYASQTFYADVRKCDQDVENESFDFRPLTITLDAGRDEVTEIKGTATLLDNVQYAAGIVRLRFRYHASRIGVQPDTFTAIRTAGPSSPANAPITVSVTAGTSEIFEIDTPALLDTSSYTYRIQASQGATTLDILTGITVNADASGPAAPTATAVEF